MQPTPVDVDEEWPFDLVLQNNSHLLETGEWADAEITCKGKTWKVHKCIICTRCKWFERAFKSGFLESTTGKVNLDEEDPVRLGELLEYIYGGHIPHMPSSRNTKHGPRLDPVHLKQRVELWCLADFFLIPNLALYLERGLMWDFAGYVEFLNCPEMEEDPCALRVFIQEFKPATCKAHENPFARIPQALMAVFAFLIQDYLPATLIQGLKDDFPVFQQDWDMLCRAPAPPAGTQSKKGKGTTKTAVKKSSRNAELWCKSYSQRDISDAVDRLFGLLPECHTDVETLEEDEENETEEEEDMETDEVETDEDYSDVSDESI
ncbi:hypothetical protein VSDG_03602 [Cytospora chrysosperma]|uniref:BTB domain-containing protein n=1 Tax=Cytospora chrysosperma TaxID=252740 RepID=A0A423W9X2_CYTCH|nr:hypothetical protein VSDG_03602 [Valsa sordida]